MDIRVCVLIVLAVLHKAGSSVTGRRQGCQAGGVAVYKLSLETFWTPESFPKQYPTYRPHAQWSRLIGRTHSSDYTLWREGHMTSDSVKQFAENAVSSDLDLNPQGQGGIFDVFNGPNIDAGVGTSRTQIFVDNKHHLVSVMSRMIPSPDWFVGADSVSVCEGDIWLQDKTLQLRLWDAGTDKGLTYTSPNWPEELQKPIETITSSNPSHPASSFYYPDVHELPIIARLTLKRESVADRHIQRDGSTPRGAPPAPALDPNPAPNKPQHHKPHVEPRAPAAQPSEPVGRKQDVKSLKSNKVKLTKEERRRRRAERQEKKRQEKQEKKRKNKQNKKPKKNRETNGLMTKKVHKDVNCHASEWQEWTPCSKTCGYGNRSRARVILVESKGRGQACPVLTEESMCGSMRGCGWSHFSSDSWGDTMGK